MIPRVYPSTLSVQSNQREMVVYYLSSVSGLTRWTDYIPVRAVQTLPSTEQTTDNNGFTAVNVLTSTSGKSAWVDYVPVYDDASATDAWVISSSGYIPVGTTGAMGGTLFLNFLSGTLDSRITFSRSTEATPRATYFGSDGLLKVADVGAPRFDYDPVTRVPKGLLIEESRANLLLQSRVVSSWTTTTDLTVTTTTGIDGVSGSASFVTEGSAGTSQAINQANAVAAGSAITGSVYLKAGNATWIRMRVADTTFTDGASVWFNIATGVKGTQVALGAGSSISSSITSVGNGWYRCVITVTPNGTYTISKLQFWATSADNVTTRVSGSTYSVDGAQIEAGAFPTSYIPTTTAAVTRAADSVSMTGTNFSSWWNATEGTFVVAYDVTKVNTARFSHAINVNDSGTVNYQLIGINTAGYQAYFSGVFDINVATVVSANTLLKTAAAYKLNDFSAAHNGTLGTPDTVGAVPVTMSQLNIGDRPGADRNLNGHISRLIFFNKRLPDATLRALTA